MHCRRTVYFIILFCFICVEACAYLPKEGSEISLEEMIDTALRNNPDTRAAWAQALASYWRYRQSLSDNTPYLDYAGTGRHSKTSRQGEGNNATSTTYNQEMVLSYLVFDFGVRSANHQSAKFAFIALDYFRDWTIQSVILEVIERYTQYLDAIESLRARESDVEDAEVNFEVANALHNAGVRTIADVLQAKTALVNAKFNLENNKGRVEVGMSRLKNSMGIPMGFSFRPKELPSDFVPRNIANKMDTLIETAKDCRSDIWASYSEVLQKQADLQRANSDGLPYMTLDWNVGRRSGVSPRENYHTDGALRLTVPLYRGYFFESGKRKARYDLEFQKSAYENAVLEAVLEVATNYWSFKTSYQQYEYSVELLKYAEESHEVTLANYKAGVSSIQALFDSQNSLTNARTQHIQSQTAWILSLARLTYSIGKLNGQQDLLSF